VALVGSALSAGMTFYGQMWSHRHSERREAQRILTRYREPLISAAFDLQSRLFNILEQHFLLNSLEQKADEHRRNVALESTLYMFAQYFCWREILRQDIQFFELQTKSGTRTVNAKLGEVTRSFAADTGGPRFRLWRPEQRAIGELMIHYDRETKTCLGYAQFRAARSGDLKSWLDPLEADLITLAPVGTDDRLRAVQHALVDLIRTLDPEQIRYDSDLRRVGSP
jgi:hypothetical protein